MKMYEIIDAHAHIYPSKIAEKATLAIGEFYDIKMQMPSGVSERLLTEGKSAGISRFIVHSVATKPEQVKSINAFIKSEIDAHKEFIGFMTLHPNMTEEEVFSEVKNCKELGFKGVKLHPDFQKFDIDGENAQKIYRAVSEMGENFPILLHTGDNRFEFSAPLKLSKMAKKYKNVSFIGAHFGGYRRWHESEVYLGLDNVYFDTCSSLPFISPELAKSLIEKHGVEKFFFATDFPMWDAKGEIERFLGINLTEKEREKIFSKNVKNLLKID